MTTTKQRLESKIDETNTAHDIDELNNQFFSPFQGMTEMYALQKGFEAGYYKGANLLAPLLLEMVEEIQFAADRRPGGLVFRNTEQRLKDVLNKFEEFLNK
jgi:hypothetical protein